MSYFSGITDVEAYHNPNEGRVIINDNFRKMISGVTESVNSISGGTSGSTSSDFLTSGDSYVKGYTFEKNLGNTITIGKGNGKLLITNGSNIISGTSGADFSQINFSSPLYYYEATIFLTDGTKRFISFSSVTGNTASVSNIYLNTNYNNPIGSVWTGDTGEYEYISYFTPDVTGELSMSFGYANIVSGDLGAYAEGSMNISIGNASHSEGRQNQAIGNYSHVEGYLNVSSGQSSHSEGNSTTAFGNSSHAEGSSTIASGSSSHAEGTLTSSLGSSSHAEGYQTIASGAYSHSEGYLTNATAQSSHAEGQQTLSSGLYSHAEGNSTSATSQSSHSEGYQNIASGLYSHSEGSNNESAGSASHSQGSFTFAKGNYSFSSGQGFNNANRVIASGSSTFVHFRNTSTNGDKGAFAEYSSILGGTNHSIELSADSSAILGGTSNFINSTGINSVIIGGNNITATTSSTVYVPNLNINSTPDSGSTSDKLLVRSTDGTIKIIEQEQLQFTAITISSSQILSAGTSQILLLPSPGVGYYYDYKIILEYQFGTIAYNNSGGSYLILWDGVSQVLANGFNLNGYTTDLVAILYHNSNNIDTTTSGIIPNRAIYLTTGSGLNPTNGDGNVIAKIWYTIRAIG